MYNRRPNQFLQEKTVSPNLDTANNSQITHSMEAADVGFDPYGLGRITIVIHHTAMKRLVYDKEHIPKHSTQQPVRFRILIFHFTRRP